MDFLFYFILYRNLQVDVFLKFIPRFAGDLDTDVLTEYIKKFSPIISGLEGRIRFVNGSVEEETGSRGGGDGGRVCLSAGTAMLSPCGTLLWMACVAICAVGLLRQ